MHPRLLPFIQDSAGVHFGGPGLGSFDPLSLITTMCVTFSLTPE
jgi:hypothetical protein